MSYTQLLSCLENQSDQALVGIEQVSVAMESFVGEYLTARHDSYYAQMRHEKTSHDALKMHLKEHGSFTAPKATLSYNHLSFRLRFFELTKKSALISENNPSFPTLYIVERKPGQKISNHVHHNCDAGYSPALTVNRKNLCVPDKDKPVVKQYITRLNHLNMLARGFKDDFISARERYLFIVENMR